MGTERECNDYLINSNQSLSPKRTSNEKRYDTSTLKREESIAKGRDSPPSKHKSRVQVARALKRMFRSRSSSPRRCDDEKQNKVKIRRPGSSPSHRTSTQDETFARVPQIDRNYMQFPENEDVVVKTSPWTPMRKCSSQLHVDNDDSPSALKTIALSKSFSCLQTTPYANNTSTSLLSLSSDVGDLPYSDRKEYYSSENILNTNEMNPNVPKVFVSLDDDGPRTPDNGHYSHYKRSGLMDTSLESLRCIEDAEDEDHHEESNFEVAAKLSDDEIEEKPSKTRRKMCNIIKSISMRRLSPSESCSEQLQMHRQQSLDFENENGQEGWASNDHRSEVNASDEKCPDPRLNVLRKLSLTLHGKDKHKSLQNCKQSCGSSFKTWDNSSEESLASNIEMKSRKGRLKELSHFLMKDSSSMSKKSSEDVNEDLQLEGSILGSHQQGKQKSFGHKVAEYLQRGGSKLQEQQRRLKSQIWSSVVTIVIVEGKDLTPIDSETFLDPYVKFRLGNEKHKSKVEMRTVNPRWLQQFDFHLFEDQSQLLEIIVMDKEQRTKDDYIGRCTLDMRNYEREVTHHVWVDLESGLESGGGGCKPAKIFLLLTISGTTSTASISDLVTHRENPNEIKAVQERYRFSRSLHNLKDVGFLTVKIFKAQGLAAADFGVGKSDPFCVLELVNARLQTQTEYKTLAPHWNKIFTFDIMDIHDVLEVTVYDEDRDHKVDFLGKIAIPLLNIKNGDKRWYSLKDKKLRMRAKGSNPEILIECSVIWNRVRAAIKTFNPREEKYMQIEPKFKRQIFVRNVNRIRAAIMEVYDFGLYIKSCFEWESPFRSVVAFVLSMVITYYFEVYMLPFILLLLFLKNYIVLSIVGHRYHKDEDAESSANEDELDEDDKDKEEKKSLKERLQAIHDVIATVQNAIGYIASLAESVKNTFNFTVPFLSILMVLSLLAATFFLYLVPVRGLIMFWLVNKFSRKLIRPHSVINNEVLDFLTRVPDDEHLRDWRELRLLPPNHEERRREAKKKKVLRSE